MIASLVSLPLVVALVGALAAAPGDPPASEGGAKDPLEVAARVEGLLAHGVPLPATSDFDEAALASIGEAIGDARIVLLGTPSYGDGAAFEVLSRLVRHLHRAEGFSVLAWESGLFDCHVMQQKLADEDVRTDEAASYGVMSVYGASAQCLPLFRYARGTLDGDRPLRMAGIDPQFTGRGHEEWLDFVLGWLAAPDDAAVPDELRKGLRVARRRLDQSPFFPTAEQLERDRDVLSRLDRLLAAEDGPFVRHHGATEVSFVRRTLQNFLVQSELRLLLHRPETREQGALLRARTIAENLVWLATERYPDARIVVWTQATHAARNLSALSFAANGPLLSGSVSAGDLAHAEGSVSAYSILVTASDGAAAVVLQPPFELPAAPDDSFEGLVRATGHDLLFVDLKHAPTEGPASFLRGSFSARPLSYVFGEGPWRDVADALLCLRTMTPSTIPPDDDFGR